MGEKRQVNHELSGSSGLSCGHSDDGVIVDQSGKTDGEREDQKERVIPEIMSNRLCQSLSDF